MATATPSILINSISGKIGNVVFYTRLGTQCVRAHVVPRNPDTQAQRAVRRSFGDAVRSWQSLTPEDKHNYNRKARYLNMSGYNLYISNYMRRTLNAALQSGMPAACCSTATTPLSFTRFPSVSESYIKGGSINTAYISLNPVPG
jgi:hypothetical protein